MLRRVALLTALLTLSAAGSSSAATGWITPRIVDGDVVQTAGDYPWQVGLTYSNGSSQYCGGTLIASKYVLTAEHCRKTTPRWVHVGSLDRTGGGEYIQVATVRRHPRADNTGEVPRYDVNILELARPVSAQYDKPLTIASPAESGLWTTAGTLFTVTGWGDTADGSGLGSSAMLSAQVPRVSDAQCASIYGSTFSSADMLCAGGGTTDTCQGDSGGPMAAPAVASPDITQPSDWRLVGVTSFGAACATPGVPGVYARIATADLYNWADTTPAVAGAATLSGTPAVGQTLTCGTAGWTGGRSFRRWQFLRDGVAGAAQFGATTTISSGDQGKTITCAAVGDNGAGQVVSAASNGLAIPAATVPDPSPTLTADPVVTEPIVTVQAPPRTAPTTAQATPATPAQTATTATAPRAAATTTSVSKVKRSCKQRTCTFTITSDATALKVTLKRGKATATIYKAKRRKNGTFTVTTGKLRKGRYVATVSGATTAKKLSFSV